MPAITDLFAFGRPPANAKIAFLGSSDFHAENLMTAVRSLHIEHVSPAGLSRREISRRPGSAAATEAAILASLRRWFFARKPDAGFILTDFPATLLQALVFDEWLDARDENLVSVLAAPDAPALVVEHYRTLGLLVIDGAALAA
jgi:adenylate kinase